MFTSITSNGTTIINFLMCMGTAILLGILNSMVFMYKTKHTKSFAFSLALLPMTVAMVIMMVNGNIGAGVAVAGAFTLVRFRSVPGSAKEISAIFTDMAIGLSVGMGYIAIAVVFFILEAFVAILLTKIDFGGKTAGEKPQIWELCLSLHILLN